MHKCNYQIDAYISVYNIINVIFYNNKLLIYLWPGIIIINIFNNIIFFVILLI